MRDRAWKPIKELAEDVQSGRTTALSLVQKSLDQTKIHKEYGTIISVLEKPAIARAKKIDARVKNGEKIGRLAGVPFIAKDNFLVFGGETTAASNILKGFKAPYQATAINKLEDEGAICIAKANLDAFAHGSSTENSDFFTTLNPHDKSRVPGGSSGGSAAAVALGLAPFALGTDTGGSIRLPASFCGVVGYKPTYGLVSRSGVVAMASSTDVIGPLASTVEDAALVLDCMAGKDELDMTTINRENHSYGQPWGRDLSDLKAGVVKEFFAKGLDKAVEKSALAAIDKLKKAGAKIEEVSLKSSPLALACYYIICPAEVSSNLSRYDGQRYGHTNPEAKTLEDSYTLSRWEGFNSEVKRRIMIGTYVLSSGYYDAYYKKAQRVRTELIKETDDALAGKDVLIGPTAPTAAFKIGENMDDPLKMYLTDILTVSSNLTGNPAISIPAAKDRSGLPIGLQVIGKQRQDSDLLAISNKIEEVISG
jgi:aspartyl-tRNA(Asn)/glutamyl-tRNA(Gln) amidotransferase subunit A